MLDVDVPAQVAERLNAASADRRWYPFDRDVIDWSVPLGPEWSYMPPGRSALEGSGVLERLDPAERSFVERWEMTQLMRNVAHGEHLLNQGVLAMLWTVDPYDPSYRYLLHEVAEECQHMAMFNEWVRRNGDIETTGAGEEDWGKELADFTEDLAVRLPEAFWVNVLLFEFIGDDFNRAMRDAPASGAGAGAGEGAGAGAGEGARPLHPILVQIGRAHTAEEARHIAYARRWLAEGMPSLSTGHRLEVQSLTEVGVQSLIDRRSFLSFRYTSQLEPYLSEEELVSARRASPGGRAMRRHLKELLDELESLGALAAPTLRRWEDEGVFA